MAVPLESRTRAARFDDESLVTGEAVALDLKPASALIRAGGAALDVLLTVLVVVAVLLALSGLSIDEAAARAIIIATIVIGIPFNWLLGGTRSALQRIAIALTSIPATVVLAVVLFSFNALVPDTYAGLLRFADWVWQTSLNALSASGDSIPGARKLTNAARQGFSGHHYVIMALCSIVASFVVNALFALIFDRRKRDDYPAQFR